MSKIINYGQSKITLTAGEVKQITFNSTRPNFVILNNNIADNVYIGLSPVLNTSTYDKILRAVSTKKVVSINSSFDSIYLYCATGGVVTFEYFQSDVKTSDIEETKEQVSVGTVLGTFNIYEIQQPLPSGTNNIGIVTLYTPTTTFVENVTLSGSAQQLSSNACKEVTIQADKTNSNTTYIGITSSVSSTVHGHQLGAGDSITLKINNTNLIYVIGTSTEKICVIGVN